MLIHNYCHIGCPLAEGAVGEISPALHRAWNRWKKALLPGTAERVSFLDMPGEDGRIILVAVPGMPEGTVGFWIGFAELEQLPSLYCFYRVLEKLNGADILEAVFQCAPIELKIEDFPAAQLPIPAVFSDLNGLQMIGPTDKSLHTVVLMLPDHDRKAWMDSFFLAVNPAAYDDEFTTVVSEEAPDGEWNKLHTEHFEFPTAKTFRLRRRAFLRKLARPRILAYLLIALACIVVVSISAFFCVRSMVRMKYRIESLEREKALLEFNLRGKNDTIRSLRQENNTLKQNQRSK